MAIELEGPSHFYRNDPYTDMALPTTQFRNDLLEAAGWTVATLSFAEWRTATSVQLKRRFAWQFLAGAGLQVVGRLDGVPEPVGS